MRFFSPSVPLVHRVHRQRETRTTENPFSRAPSREQKKKKKSRDRPPAGLINILASPMSHRGEHRNVKGSLLIYYDV